jgi:hypothetical protein
LALYAIDFIISLAHDVMSIMIEFC